MTIVQVMDMRPEAAAPETEIRQAFDYSQIDEGIRDEVREAARSIHQLSAGVVTGIIAIGKRLIEVKGMLGHGQFSDWIAAEFELSERMAQNYMNVARHYGDGQKRNNISFFNPTVLYLLSAPSTPEEARAEVEQAASEGKKITVEFAKEAIQKHRPEPPAFAPVWQLESKLKEWLTIQEREAAGPPDACTVSVILDTLKMQTTQTLKPDTLLAWLDKWLLDQGVQFRKSDLVQALGNVREQRRAAKRQAPAAAASVSCAGSGERARVVYVESQPVSTPAPEPEPPHKRVRGLLEHDPDGPSSVERVRALRDAEPEPVVLGTVAKGDLPAMEPEPEAQPDLGPDARLAEAKALRDLLIEARRRVNADYGRLCGKYTDALAWFRGCETMIANLNSLIAILGGESE